MKKLHTVICGAGKMGRAIGFAMKHFKHDISIVETNTDCIDAFIELNGDCKVLSHWSQIENKPDVLISSLPYHAVLDAALWAIDNDVRYCDLGGSVPVSASVKEIASRKATRPVMTDLGLAPGWINIMAEEIRASLHGVDSITMMVGGIPSKPDNDPLNYMTTWSIDGLLNEYMDDCEILVEGIKKTVSGMSGLENVVINDMELECFYTSGASAHSISTMDKHGVKNCSYKTLRWRGHCTFMKYLLDVFATEPSLTNGLKVDTESIKRILSHSHKMHQKDMVVMKVEARKGSDVSVSKNRIIHANDQFTAMQIATAFPIASVAHLMAKGAMDKTVQATYADIDIPAFNLYLDSLLAKHGHKH